MKLWELTNELQFLLDAVEAANGEITPEQEQMLNTIQMDRARKIESICAMIRRCQASIAAQEAEIARIQSLRKAPSNLEAFLKRYLKQELERSGELRYEAPTCKAWVQANSVPTIKVSDPALLPREFVEERVSVAVVTAKILAAYKRGETMPECVTVEEGTHLRIK